jgi:hypothetical protein
MNLAVVLLSRAKPNSPSPSVTAALDFDDQVVALWIAPAVSNEIRTYLAAIDSLRPVKRTEALILEVQR